MVLNQSNIFWVDGDIALKRRRESYASCTTFIFTVKKGKFALGRNIEEEEKDAKEAMKSCIKSLASMANEATHQENSTCISFYINVYQKSACFYCKLSFSDFLGKLDWQKAVYINNNCYKYIVLSFVR